MLPARRPGSAESVGVLWPMLRKGKEMWITAVHVQLPNPRKIILQAASRHRYTNSLGVRRKNGTARHHMVCVPNFLFVLPVRVTHINRFLFVERHQLPIRRIARAARRDISQPLRRTSEHGHSPYSSPLRFVVQIALQQQKLRAIRRNIQDSHGADRGAEKRRVSPLYGHFDRILPADEVNTRPVGEDRGAFGFARKGQLLHRQWKRISGYAVAGKRNPPGSTNESRCPGPNPDPLPRLFLLCPCCR